MAVVTKPEAPVRQDTEAQGRLRRAIADVVSQLRHPNKSDLLQARTDLERYWTACSQELRRLAAPLAVQAPRLLGKEPEPAPERLEQLAAIEHAVRVLEDANQARARANLALFQLR
jgi:hypothetical protein